jgi:hypothetical protein
MHPAPISCPLLHPLSVPVVALAIEEVAASSLGGPFSYQSPSDQPDYQGHLLDVGIHPYSWRKLSLSFLQITA